MKALCIIFYFSVSAGSYQTAQYDQIDINEIAITGTKLTNVNNLLEALGKPESEKLYTPPPGDTDAYDEVKYLTFDSLRLTLHLSGKDERLASVQIESSNYELNLGDALLHVGDHYLILKSFHASYNEFRKASINKSGKATGKMHFHISVNNMPTERIITISIDNDRIKSVSIVFDPA